MKKILMFVLCLIYIGTMFGQTKEKGFYVGVSYGIYPRFTNTYVSALTPSVGYKWNDKWFTGVRAGFEVSTESYMNSLGMVCQYTLFNKKGLKVALQGSADYFYDQGHLDFAHSMKDIPNVNYTEIGLTPTFSLSIYRHLDFIIQYLYLGYSTNDFFYREGIVGDKCIMDFGIEHLKLGLRYIF